MKIRIVKPFIVQTAREFWKSAGNNEKIPCDIERGISLALPLTVILLPDLSIKIIEDWFVQNNVTFTIGLRSRLLHGFLICRQGEGFIFVNGTDSEDERRFTLAHEVSHFIIEYFKPRKYAIEKFGEGILDVLDGLRLPTISERVDGIINYVNVKPFTHLLEKQAGDFENHYIWQSENDADELALEILAPCQKVSSMVDNKENRSFQVTRDYIYNMLVNAFLLPKPLADGYSNRIALGITGGTSVREKLGL